MTISIIEIYKEKLKDLLNPKTSNDDLKIQDDHSNGSTIITNLHRECVDSKEATLKIIETGLKIRNIHESFYNKFSSRSHVIVMVEINQKSLDGIKRRSVINLVDLACGEKVRINF